MASIELETLGEEQDEYTKSTSKLRDLVKGTTGFDIIKADGSGFKDLYDIVLGIGDAWKNLDDLTRSGLAEALAGKRNARGLYSIFSNMEDLEGAYETARNAAGSAEREQEHYAESVQYSIDRAKASLEQLANDFLASDLLKGLIEAGNTALQVIDKIVAGLGSVQSILLAITGMSALKSLFGAESFVGNLLGAFTTKMTGQEVGDGLLNILKTFFTKGGPEEVGNVFAKGLSKVFKKNRAITGVAESLVDTITDNIDDGLVGTIGDTAVDAMVSGGVRGAMTSAGASAGTEFIAGFASVLNPVTIGVALAAAAAGIGFAIYKGYRDNIDKQKINGPKEWEASKKSLDDYIASYQSLYDKLQQSDLSEQEQLQIKQQLLDLQHQIVDAYGSEASNIDLVNGKLEKQLATMDNIAKKQAEENYKENKAGYEEAKNIMMSAVSDSTVGLGTLTNPTPKTQKTLQSLFTDLNKIDGVNAKLGEYYDENATQQYEISIDYKDVFDASEGLQSLEDAIDSAMLSAEDLGDEGSGLVTFFEDLKGSLLGANGTGGAFGTYNKKWQDNYKAAITGMDLEFIRKGGNKYLRDMQNAISEYNTAVGEMDTEKMDKALSHIGETDNALKQFAKDKGISDTIYKDEVEQMMDSIDKAGAESVYRQEALSHALSQIQTEEDKTVKKQKETAQKISDNNIYKEYIPRIEEFSKAIKDANMDVVDVEATFDKIGDAFKLNNITDGEQAVLNIARMLGYTKDQGKEFAQFLADNQLVTGTATEQAQQYAVSIDDIATAAQKAMSSIDAVNAALVSSISGKGMSYEYTQDDEGNIKWQGDVQNIMDAFGTETFKKSGLYNAATLFRRTSNGIKINTKELRKLQKAQEDITRDKFYETQTELSEALLAAEAERAAAAARGEDTSAITAKIAKLQENISQVQLLASAYDGAASAYQKWLDAQSAGEEGDIYKNIQENAFKRGDELIEEGLIGSNELRALTELMSGKDLTNASVDEVLNSWNALKETIPETSYSMRDFFKEGGEGVYNFVNALDQLGLAEGNWEEGWDFERMNIDELAEKLGTSNDVIESLFGMLSERGWTIYSYTDKQIEELEEVDKQIETFKSDHEGEETHLKIAADIEGTDDVEELDSTLEYLQGKLQEQKVLGIDFSEIETLEELIDLCIQKKNILTGSDATGTVSLETFEAAENTVAEMEGRIEKIQQANEKGLNLKVEDDEQLQEDAKLIADLPPEIKMALGFNVDSDAQEILDILSGKGTGTSEGQGIVVPEYQWNPIKTPSEVVKEETAEQEQVEVPVEVLPQYKLDQIQPEESFGTKQEDVTIGTNVILDGFEALDSKINEYTGKAIEFVADVTSDSFKSLDEMVSFKRSDNQINYDANIKLNPEEATANLKDFVNTVQTDKHSLEQPFIITANANKANEEVDALQNNIGEPTNPIDVTANAEAAKQDVEEVKSLAEEAPDPMDVAADVDEAKDNIADMVGSVPEEIHTKVVIDNPQPTSPQPATPKTTTETVVKNEENNTTFKTTGAAEAKKDMTEVQDIAAEGADFNVNVNADDVSTVKDDFNEIGDSKEVSVDVDLSPEQISMLAELDQLKAEFDATSDETRKAEIQALGLDAIRNLLASGMSFQQLRDHTVTHTIITKNITQNTTSPVNGTAHLNGTIAGFYGAAHVGGDWRTKKDEVALTAELGPEIMVNGKTGKWELLGQYGAQFTHVPAGSIIFNHKQTEDLLQHGYTLGRAHANGTVIGGPAYSGVGGNGNSTAAQTLAKVVGKAVSDAVEKKTSSNGDNTKTSSSDKKTETASQKFSDWLSSLFNWAEVRLTRLNRLTERWSDRAEKAVRYAYNNITDDDTITRQYKKAADYYVKAINASANEIIGQQKAEKTYTKNLAKIKSKGKLDNKTIKKIKDDTINGTFKLEEYKDSSSSSSNSNKKNQKLEAIKAYQDYYEKVLACQDAVEDLKESQKDLWDTYYNLPLEQANAKVEKLTANIQALQAVASATAGGSRKFFTNIVADARTAKTTAESDQTKAQKEYNAAQSRKTAADKKVKSVQKKYNKAKKGSAQKSKLKKQLNSAKSKQAEAKENLYNKDVALRGAKSATQYATTYLSNVEDYSKNHANSPYYEFANYNLDQQYEEQKAIDAANREALESARRQKAEAESRIAIAEEAAKKAETAKKNKGSAIANNKAYKKLLTTAQKKQLNSGQKVSTKGVKDDKLLKALKAYNKLVEASTKADKEATDATTGFTSAEDALTKAELAAVTSTAELTEMQQENAKAKVDNIISYYENAEKMKDAEYAQLEAQERLNEANGVSQVGDEARLLIEQKIAKQREKNALKQEKYDKAWAEFEKQKATMTEEAAAEVEASLKQELNAITDGAVQLKQLEKDLSNLKLTELGMQLEDLATAAEKLQDELDFKTESGAILTADDYERQIDNAEAQKAIIEQENAELEKQIALYDPLSKEGRELQSQLNANNKEYRSLTMSQLKWSKAIAQLPFDALERVKNELQGINDLLTAQQDLTAEYGIEKSAKDYLDSIQSNVDILQNYMETAALAELKYQQALESADGTYEGKHYTEWKQMANDANKSVLATEKTIVNLRNAMRTLPVDILQKAADLIGTIVSYNQSLDDLKVAMGFELEASDYESQLWDLNEQINSAEALRNQYYEYYQRALTDAENPGYLYGKSAKEWLKLYYDMGTQSNNLQKNWYSLRKELADLPIKELKKYIDELSRLEDQVNSLFDLVSDFTTFKDNGSALTNWGITQFNLTAQAMEKAREQIAEYQTAIEALNYQLEKGLITQDEADEQIKSYRSDVMSSASSLKKYRDTILNYIKDGINKEIDAMSELIDKRKEALQRQKEADNYAKTVRDKTREINKLQMQIASMSGDTSKATLAKIKQLNAQLQEAQEDLDETRKDHSYDMLIQGLEDEEKAFEKAQKDRIKELESSLDAQNKAIKSSLQYTTSQYQTTADDIASIAKEYGIELEEAITEPWESGSNAFKTFVNATTALDTVEAKILDIKNSLDEYSNLHIQIDPTDLATVESEIAALKERLAAAIELGLDDLATKLQSQIDILQTKYDAQVDINTSNAQQAGTGELDNLPSFFERQNEIAQNNAQIIADAIAEAMPEEESEDTELIVGPGEDDWAMWQQQEFKEEVVTQDELSAIKGVASDILDAVEVISTNDNNPPVIDVSTGTVTNSSGTVIGQAQKTDNGPAITSTSTIKTINQVAADNVAKTVARAEAQLAGPSKGDQLKTTQDDVKMWSKAADSGKGDAIATIPKNKKVEYLAQKTTAGGTTYYKVTYGKKTGWVKSTSLKAARLGTKAAMRGLYLTDEEGIGSEAIITNKGALRQLNAGDMVFNAKQKEELWKLSKMDLSALDKIKPTSNQTSINNTYGSLLTVNGDVTRDALPELKEILKQAYEYTSKQMYMTQRKKGF